MVRDTENTMLFQYHHSQTCICWLEPNPSGKGYITYSMTVDNPVNRNYLPEQALLYLSLIHI